MRTPLNASTKRLTLNGEAGAVEALLDEPSLGVGGSAKGTAFVMHPHPLFGGTMENKVVQTMARAFVQSGWRALRFNFRGVGESAGVHDEGRGELADLLALVEQCAPAGPLGLAGFSFGSFVASRAVESLHPSREISSVVLVGTAASRFGGATLPTDLRDQALLIHGEQDETVPLVEVFDWARPQSLPVTVIPGASHFFHGQLLLLRRLVARHLNAPS